MSLSCVESEYNQAELEGMDMHSLNLFGLPLTEGQEGDLRDIGSNQETQRVLRELIELSDEMGGAQLGNFGVRKSFVYYDPYEPDESVAHAYLKFEDSTKLRASVVLDFYKSEVEALRDEDLTFADKERKEQVLKLITYMSDLKVVDAPVLFKLYDLYRYKV